MRKSFIACLFLCFVSACGQAPINAASTLVRSPAVAGAFYPASRAALDELLSRYLAAAPPVRLDGKIAAIISPHAGYVYSGPTAARAFRALDGLSFDTVVIVGPSHHWPLNGYSVWAKGSYRTPLGDVPVDGKTAAAILGASPLAAFDPRAHRKEHSVEVMLPFLQHQLKGFKIVPIVMGRQSRAVAGDLSRVLCSVCRGKKILLVASTDLSHYRNLADTRKMDGLIVKAIGDFDEERFLGLVERGEAQACGYGPAYAVMKTAKSLGFDKSLVTGYDTSATASGDTGRVVGYVSAVLFGKGRAGAMEHKDASTEIFSLSDEEKRILLRLARDTIAAKAAGRPLPRAVAGSEKLNTKSGAFVTLKEHGRLRGCIGFIVAHLPLVETIAEMAVSAAFRDPRFPPVTADEVDSLEIEISVLSPFVVCDDPGKIKVGTHGIQISRGMYSGLLLPQVATEYGWDRVTFLEHTCAKAGLPEDAWKESGTEIKIFTAEIFNEEQLGLGPGGR